MIFCLIYWYFVRYFFVLRLEIRLDSIAVVIKNIFKMFCKCLLFLLVTIFLSSYRFANFSNQYANVYCPATIKENRSDIISFRSIILDTIIANSYFILMPVDLYMRL